MSSIAQALPRLRQAVVAASELETTSLTLRQSLSLGDPFSDPGVAYFGLRNAVFAIGDTFLEVVSPVQGYTAVGRHLTRRGGDCGYMVMFEVEDLPAARARAAALGVREVFEVELDDIAEVHLHPADMVGAIVALSAPRPRGAWRWGGPGWEQRSAAGGLDFVTIAVRDPEAVADRWAQVIGEPVGVRFTEDASERGLVEISVSGTGPTEPVQIAGVRFSSTHDRMSEGFGAERG